MSKGSYRDKPLENYTKDELIDLLLESNRRLGNAVERNLRWIKGMEICVVCKKDLDGKQILVCRGACAESLKHAIESFSE